MSSENNKQQSPWIIWGTVVIALVSFGQNAFDYFYPPHEKVAIETEKIKETVKQLYEEELKPRIVALKESVDDNKQRIFRVETSLITGHTVPAIIVKEDKSTKSKRKSSMPSFNDVEDDVRRSIQMRQNKQ